MRRGDKRRERELAFQALYGLSFSPATDLARLEEAFLLSPHNSQEGHKPVGFAWDLVKGVWENEARLDERIGKLSRNWRPERMGRIELVILRLALHEMIAMATPAKVVMSEYMELAHQFGAGSAGSFINGILDAAAKSRAAMRTESGTQAQKGGKQ